MRYPFEGNGNLIIFAEKFVLWGPGAYRRHFILLFRICILTLSIQYFMNSEKIVH